MNEGLLLVVAMFIGLIVGLITGHPLAFVLGGLGAIFGYFGWGPQAFDIFVNRIFATMGNYTLVAIPLFILMANFLTASKIADGLFESVRYLFGSLRGGVALAVIFVSAIFAATTGIVGASVVTMGLLGIPVLLKYDYQKELSTGVVAAGGTLGILIPPSIMLVLMGTQAQISVGQLFMGAITPGLVLTAGYALYILIICWLKPDLGPALSAEEIAATSMKKILMASLINLVPPLLLIAGVLGTIYAGVATPTEASGIGAFLAMVLTVFYKKFNLEMLKDCLYRTAETTAMCMIILVGAAAFTSMFLGLEGDVAIANLVAALGLGKWGIFTLTMVVVFILGMFIDWMGIVMIVFPIFLPLAEAQGFNMLWFVIVIAVMLQTSFMTPPFGYALFYLKGIVPENVTLGHIYRGVVPFIIMVIVVIVLITIFPNIVLWLPQHAKM